MPPSPPYAPPPFNASSVLPVCSTPFYSTASSASDFNASSFVALSNMTAVSGDEVTFMVRVRSTTAGNLLSFALNNQTNYTVIFENSTFTIA
jgi:hypothetical protein